MPKIKNNETGLAGKLKAAGVKAPKKQTKPLWDGPTADGPMGGITQSMLSGYFVCKERFRLKYVEGLRPVERFEARMEYGQMWHICEEALAHNPKDWDRVGLEKLRAYCQRLCQIYPMQQEDIEKWYHICRRQFPIYVEYWKNHKDNVKRIPLAQEKVFDVGLELPSGRVARLRGKFDAVDVIDTKMYLQENKTKSEIDAVALERQLKFDLQTMMYLTAMQLDSELNKKGKIGGIRYNVIRRPLAGGKGSIVRHKATKNHPEETWDHFYGRVVEYINAEPDTYFARWKVEIQQSDIERFKQVCLIPVLEEICDRYQWWGYCMKHQINQFGNAERAMSQHYITPFGIYNTIAENGNTDYDEYLMTGSEVGLTRVETLFMELQ